MDIPSIPSVFDTAQPLVNRVRLETLKNKLIKERQLQYLNEVERIRVLNLLTYVYHCSDNDWVIKDGTTGTTDGIGNAEVICTTQGINNDESISPKDSLKNTAGLDNAYKFNDEAIKLSAWTNVVSILYRFHLLKEVGDRRGVEQCRVKLQEMVNSNRYELKLAEAQAEMAYSYARLGGSLDNARWAIHWYDEALKKYNNYDWKFGLGQAHSHVVCWYRNSPDITICQINKHINAAVKNVMDAAENSSDTELRSFSYSKLAVLKRELRNAKLETENSTILYKGYDIQSLAYKALEFDPKNYKTLRDCGRLLKHVDVDKAIEVLEKSVKIWQNSLTYHNLGLCYEIKARQNADREKNEIKMEEKSQLDGASERCEPFLTNDENIENKDEGAIVHIPDFTKQRPIVSASNNLKVSVTESRSVFRARGDLILISGLTGAKNPQALNQTPESPKEDAFRSLEQLNEPQPDFKMVNSTGEGRKKKNKKKKRIANYIHCPIVLSRLDRQDENVQKAIEYHKISIEDNNYLAMYTLGLILRSCGCLQEAKANFQRIIGSSALKKEEYIVKTNTVVCAHLQIGLCLLDSVDPSEADYDECEAQMSMAIDAVGTLTSDPSVADKLKQGLSEVMESVRQKSNADAQKPRNAFRKFVNSVKKKLLGY